MRNGLLAEFDSPAAILAATKSLRERGYERLDAYTPYQVPGLEEAIGIRRSWIPRAVLGAALSGGALAYLVQWWTTVRDYPLDVGGRPYHSAPAFVPITFEMCVLVGVLTAVVTLGIATGLPRYWDPLFEVDGFERASIDRFFLGIDLDDPRFASTLLEPMLRDAGAVRVVKVGVIT